MPAFGRFSEATVEQMRALVTRRDWPGFQRLVAQVAQRAEALGVHGYRPGDIAWLALFLDGEIRGGRMELAEARLVLGEYDRFLGGKLKDPAKYLSRFLSHQRSLGRPPFVMVKRCDESPFPDSATLVDVGSDSAEPRSFQREESFACLWLRVGGWRRGSLLRTPARMMRLFEA